MIVGIDLGTTHCVVAFAEPEGAPTLFAIPQLVSDGREGAPRLLPSFLYAPLAAEGADGPFALRDGESTWLVGTFAQARGAEAAGRLVSSSKSWLSYPRVDRRAPILPWRLAGDPQEDEHLRDVAQISPVTAASLLLRHIQRAWDAAHPDAPLAQQRVVLTVPASFDAVARELTVTAARAVGLDVRLLEEPQAAFYDLMRRGGDAALRHALGDGE
ncbi:MAG: Hsp70 family protein, partial [Myxococcales bacterium]|nr:Hsp70 family protein [Myxococcales bacterium]